MPLLYLGLALVFLLVLMIRFRLNAFFALLLSAFFAGLLNGMDFTNVLEAIIAGIGSTVGSLILILTFGAMLGKILETSGAAFSITNTIVQRFGRDRIKYAILLAGFVIGMPMMYNASFLVLIPIVYAFSHFSKVPLMQLGIPLSAALSVAHAYLPPHPAPVVVANMYGADINQIFVIGLVFSIPALWIAGIILPKFFSHLQNKPPEALFNPTAAQAETYPSFGASLLCATLPFLLMAAGAMIPDSERLRFLNALSSPDMALFISVLWALYFLGVRRGTKMQDLMKTVSDGASSIAMIVLIIAAGGAFKEVLTDSGTAHYIETLTDGIALNPLIVAWSTAALLRLAIGSATVATITAAGIMSNVATSSSISPELMVLATGSGSLMFSHFNDIGFWMFKEYYQVSVKETFQIWTVMECLVGIVGLICCLIAQTII